MRLFPAGFLALLVALPAGAKPPKEAEYKRADADFYLRRDVLQGDPGAIILPAESFRSEGDSYFFHPHKKAPHEIYLSETLDWLEPITPPSMPLSPAELGIAPDEMQLRELQGDVQVAQPSAPSSFAPATDKMVIPDGTIVKTGAGGTAAVLFGGVNSARLTPNTQVSVEQTITPELRSTRVDLQSGAVFSKVGMRPGEKQDYEVRTSWGTAFAKGTDFLTVADADHADVFVAQGDVVLLGASGKQLGEAKSDGKGSLQIIQSALAATPVTDELTMACNFIPTVDLKIKALHDKVSSGGTLSGPEKKYLGLLRRVPVLLKLALVEPPAPPPAPVPIVKTPPPAPTPPPVAVPAPEPSPAPTANASNLLVTKVDLSEPPPPPGKPLPLTVLKARVRADGSVRFQGKTFTSGEFEPALDTAMKKGRHEVLILRADSSVSDTALAALTEMGTRAGLKEVRIVPPRKNMGEEASAVPRMKARAVMMPRPLVNPPETAAGMTATPSSTGGSAMDSPVSDTSQLPSEPLPPMKPGGNDTVP